MKIDLLTLMGSCLLFASLSMSVTSCGKKGDLIRPLPPEVQQTQSEEQENKQKSNNTQYQP